MFEVVFFTTAIWLSGLLGENPQSANQIALNLSSMTFMIASGLSVSAMIRVGNQKGLKDYNNLRRISFSIFLQIFMIEFIFAILFFLYCLVSNSFWASIFFFIILFQWFIFSNKKFLITNYYNNKFRKIKIKIKAKIYKLFTA